MRQVQRGGRLPPPSLAKPDASGKTELQLARDYMAAAVPGVPVKSYPFKVYRSDDVKARLALIFHGKCAYCESTYGYQAPLDVEHYRPKGQIEGNGPHPGYWWLAAEWTNLLPSCIDCNRRRKQKTPQISASLAVLYTSIKTGKRDSFPIEGTYLQPESTNFSIEKPLLLDPTRDDPDEHIRYCFDDNHFMGIAYPVKNSAATIEVPFAHQNPTLVARHATSNSMSVRGAVSIQCYGLNRLGLVQQRMRIVQQLRFLESVLTDVSIVKQEIAELDVIKGKAQLDKTVAKLQGLEDRILEEMKSYAKLSAPYSTIAKAYLADFVLRLKTP